MENVHSNLQRADLYVNRLPCALRDLGNIVMQMQHGGGYPPIEVQQIETLRENIRTIYILLVQLPVTYAYSY